MRILAADTSTKVVSVAFLEDESVKALIHENYKQSQGSSLIYLIKQLLDTPRGTGKTATKINEIDLFAVGLGPGSFTGLRTSLASMRSLSIALQKPIIGVPSFDIIAWGLVQTSDFRLLTSDLCVMSDARQNKAYARFYKSDNGNIEPATDFILDNLENILNKIKEPTTITGDMIPYIKNKDDSRPFKELGRINKKGRDENITFAEEKFWYPRAEILAKIAKKRYDSGQRDDPYKLLPLYIYPKECQVKK